MPRTTVLDGFPTPPLSPEDLVKWAGDLQRAVSAALRRIQESRGPIYTTTNVSEDRTFDADTVLVDELADVVGTLIADLRVEGIVREA